MTKKTIFQLRFDLAQNIKASRKVLNLAQEKLALDAGVDRTVVSKIEREITNPSLDVLLRLANALNTEVSDLLASDKSKKY